MDMSKFSREELIMAGVALLLAIDLLFLPWFDVTVSIGSFKASFTSSATGEPDGWLGVLAVLSLVALDRRPGGGAPRQRRPSRDRRQVAPTPGFALAAVAAAFVVAEVPVPHPLRACSGSASGAAVVLDRGARRRPPCAPATPRG